MPDQAEIEAELRRLLGAARETEPVERAALSEVTDEIDSLEGVELVIAAEHRYGVAIPDTELNRVSRSINKLAALIEKKLNEATTAATEPS
jgi:acyl carrier protein